MSDNLTQLNAETVHRFERHIREGTRRGGRGSGSDSGRIGRIANAHSMRIWSPSALIGSHLIEQRLNLFDGHTLAPHHSSLAIITGCSTRCHVHKLRV